MDCGAPWPLEETNRLGFFFFSSPHILFFSFFNTKKETERGERERERKNSYYPIGSNKGSLGKTVPFPLLSHVSPICQAGGGGRSKVKKKKKSKKLGLVMQMGENKRGAKSLSLSLKWSTLSLIPSLLPRRPTQTPRRRTGKNNIPGLFAR